MAKWAHSDVLDGGLAAIRGRANKMILVKAYTAADNYTTVNTTNNIAEAAMTVNTDYTLGNGASSARTLTTASGKTGTASGDSGGTPNLHLAFVETGTSTVLWVTDISPDIVVSTGNTVNFPSVVYTSNQPT